MKKLVEALNRIGIRDLIKDEKKKATNYFTRGLIECGNRLNEDIRTVEKHLKRLTNS